MTSGQFPASDGAGEGRARRALLKAVLVAAWLGLSVLTLVAWSAWDSPRITGGLAGLALSIPLIWWLSWLGARSAREYMRQAVRDVAGTVVAFGRISRGNFESLAKEFEDARANSRRSAVYAAGVIKMPYSIRYQVVLVARPFGVDLKMCRSTTRVPSDFVRLSWDEIARIHSSPTSPGKGRAIVIDRPGHHAITFTPTRLGMLMAASIAPEPLVRALTDLQRTHSNAERVAATRADG
jgi:hypothetical protein